jgi:transposase
MTRVGICGSEAAGTPHLGRPVFWATPVRMSEPISMRKVREVLRLRFECCRQVREIAASCRISPATVGLYLKRALNAGLDWEHAAMLSDAEVEARLFRYERHSVGGHHTVIDFEWVHRELRRKYVTLQLLWTEYQESARQHADGTEPYQYSQFCDLYRKWRKKLSVVLRQVHRAGEKAFIDYSGRKPQVIDAETGEVHDVELFVMVLGASNYTYAEATRSQTVGDFVSSNVRAFEYFNGVPEVLVPDQLRSAVAGPHRYDPDINMTYLEMARHYGVTVLPARPRKPRDKAKVEVGVQIAQRWILARLRHRQFFSLTELNEAIAELLEELNRRPFKKLAGCRRSAFEELDRPAMQPLPSHRYEPSIWKTVTVHPDYHVDFDDRYYSAPCALIGESVDIRGTPNTVELFHRSVRVACHVRSYGPKYKPITCPEHRPRSHQEYGKWPPERVSNWAAQKGPNVQQVVELVLGRYPRPELGYRAAMGVIRLGDRYGTQRLDAACARALSIGVSAPRCKYIESILKHRLDAQPLAVSANEAPPLGVHEHVRGGDYYDTEV